MSVITSRDNPRVRRWRELARDPRERRRQQRAMIEGEHLVLAFLQSGRKVESLIVSKSGSDRAGFMALAARSGTRPAVLADSVFRAIADAGTPAGIAAEIALPDAAFEPKTSAACVLLEGVQDPGNVGAILRSAAAFGIGDAVLGTGCADAWSPKVLRAAMGAHFSMRIAENADLAAVIDRFGGKVLCTVPRGGKLLAEADLSGRIAWLFGAEGQGVSEALAARASLRISIPMQCGTESLNVAATAAICFYEARRRISTLAARA
ncbi:MAG TPA: RNA methyltransferase [Burkholderiales bacterium]|nr:RNA methyltransferase [Burkholderiales bacterium]